MSWGRSTGVDLRICSPHDSLRCLLNRAGKLSGQLRPLTYQTLIGLLASTGLRISEALALTTTDVRAEAGATVLLIRQSKFQQSRMVPVHPSVQSHLLRYARRREDACPQARYFFVSDAGAALGYFTACRVFRRLARGIRPTNGRPNVRLHDLRHTFASRVLLKWQRRRKGAIGRIAILARYLGHSHLRDTYWYLSAAPTLFEESAKAFDPRHR